MAGNKYGANPHSFGGINFKSLAEIMVYKTLKECGLNPQYEQEKFVIWEGFKPIIPFYDRDKKTKELKLQSKKIIDITYTPDFIFYYKGIRCIIEVKGMENDVFYIKKKLFRKYLEGDIIPSIYFEIRTKRELLQAIEIIKEYERTGGN